MSRAGQQGLFAFDDDTFHHHFQDTPVLDHAAWFEEIGLPSSGPEYDALLRGKVYEDIDTDRVMLGYYGTAYLSNSRFNTIVKVFELDENSVVEKMLNEPY
jgi:hypothetical protein